ncbi:MAG: ion transporter [Leptospiraceae bacterium]|nr:ion transporter [Leptospiraceae bacterium]
MAGDRKKKSVTKRSSRSTTGRNKAGRQGKTIPARRRSADQKSRTASRARSRHPDQTVAGTKEHTNVQLSEHHTEAPRKRTFLEEADAGTPTSGSWRARLHEIIFEAETEAGRLFDVVLLWAIVLSVVAVILESVRGIRLHAGMLLSILEWTFTGLFTIEYILRIISVRRPLKYIFSFFGMVDLLSILPAYISLFSGQYYYLTIVRILRLLRIFRIFKLARYLGAAQTLLRALRAARPKITVFMGAAFSVVVIIGTLMYVIEGEEHGFTSIPTSIYWAIVTLTTVGYGDITPQTVAGKALAALAMFIGYGIIVVPTGIVSAEFVQFSRQEINTQSCPDCAAEGHAADALFCRHCGARL